MHWQRWLIWGIFIFVVYELRDFFFVAFTTFLLCYLVRTSSMCNKTSSWQRANS